MVTFMNAFFSYLLLAVIMAVIAGGGLTVGILLRRKKDAGASVTAENGNVE